MGEVYRARDPKLMRDVAIKVLPATLIGADGSPRHLDRTQTPGRDWAVAAGRIHRVNLPPTLTAGSYDILVESALGRTTVTRELGFSVPTGQSSNQ
jgi:hypothetical protein